MKCLVTGGAGFIGSHLVDRLIADGHEVHVWDDLSTGLHKNVNDKAWIHLAWLGDQNQYDWVFHLAGRADLVPSIEQPDEYVKVNVTATVQALEHARRHGCRRFVYAASSSCYGAFPVTPTDENQPIQPAHPYALSKRLGEEAALNWMRVYGLPVVSLRLFNVYGPRARTTGAYGAVMGTFLAQRAQCAPLTVIGDGKQARDFVWVEDVADAFVKAADSDRTGVYNIGTGEAVSINRLAALIGGPIVRIPARGGEPNVTQADTSRATRELNWTARTSITDGIGRLLSDLTPYKNATLWTPATIADATEQWHKHLG
jgi:UDP-glucose 4-epimerase